MTQNGSNDKEEQDVEMVVFDGITIATPSSQLFICTDTAGEECLEIRVDLKTESSDNNTVLDALDAVISDLSKIKARFLAHVKGNL